MNNEKKQAPRCPYCGAEMFILCSEILGWSEEDDDNEPNLYWYRCLNDDCGCTSPAKRTEEEAYNEAVKCYEEPNRVLTLEEVLKIACDDYNTPEQEIVLWLERRGEEGGYATIPNIFAEDGKNVLEFSGIGFDVALITECYGKYGRCWRRKPTKNERENTPWEDEGR